MNAVVSTPATVLSTLERTTDAFAHAGVDSPRLCAELLLGRVLGLERISLYAQFDRPLTGMELTAFEAFVGRRLKREPVQYILGDTSFMGLTFRVSPHVLIPRPETELLVERVMEEERARPGTTRRVLDIGTGSGCIAVAVAHFVPGAHIDAIDVSAEALALARSNARELLPGGNERVAFCEADVRTEPYQGPRGPFDLIVSNPPYISESELLLCEPEVRSFEPRVATTDGADGLTFYRAIARLAGSILSPGGRVMVEVGHDQAERVQAIFRAAGAGSVATFNDYAGIARIVQAGGY